jgi:hypothetical protein
MSGSLAMTDQELLALMPETMRDEFSYAARVCSDATGGQVKPGIFRVALNTAALEYARAVLSAADAKPTSLEATLQPQDKLDRLIAQDRDAALTELHAASAEARPAGGSVERVETRAGGDGRAAIREVAKWLRTGRLLHAAELLEREAER